MCLVIIRGSMQLHSGCATGAACCSIVGSSRPGKWTDLSGEARKATENSRRLRIPVEVRSVRTQSHSTDQQGLEKSMECKTVSTRQPSVCAAPAYDKHLLSSADAMPVAVAEFRGPVVHGLVQFVQLTEGVTSINATFAGLKAGALHSWTVNEFGDLRRGPASTGRPFNPPGFLNGTEEGKTAGKLDADMRGHANFSVTTRRLSVADVIGRSVVVYETSQDEEQSGIAAAVIARSAGKSGNQMRQTLCQCDGTVIWDSEAGCI